MVKENPLDELLGCPFVKLPFGSFGTVYALHQGKKSTFKVSCAVLMAELDLPYIEFFTDEKAGETGKVYFRDYGRTWAKDAEDWENAENYAKEKREAEAKRKDDEAREQRERRLRKARMARLKAKRAQAKRRAEERAKKADIRRGKEKETNA